MNTTALTDFFCPVFSAFCFFGFMLCPVFWRVFFFERNEKKDKIQNKTTKNKKRKKDHKMQTRRPLSLVTKKTTQNRNNTNELCFKMETNNSRQNKQEQKHKT